MDSEEKKLLKEVYSLAKENSRNIKKIRLHMRLGTLFRVVYWVLIVGAAIGLFYFVQPFIDQAISTYTGLTDRVDTVNSFLTGDSNE